MKILFAVFLAAATSQSVCCGNVTNLPPALRKTLEDVPRFREVHSTTNLPSQVIEISAGERKIANPGQKWEASDEIFDATIPQTRLFWGAESGDLWLVHYESGGRGHAYHFLLVQYTQGNKKATILWHAIGRPLKDYAAFLRALERNELDDTVDYVR